MRKLTCIIIFIILSGKIVYSQYFQYSLYEFTQDRINPAMVAADNYAQIDFIFRNQNTSQELKYQSTYAAVKYPIMNKKRRWSGVAISFLNDQTGVTDIYGFNQASIDYAINLPISRTSDLSVGFRGSFQNKSLSLVGLSTGSQFVEYRGFDQGIPSGEPTSGLNTNYFTLSTGIYWQKFDGMGEKSRYLGVSLYDFNRPDISFLENDSERQNTTAIVSGGFSILKNKKWTVSPEVLLTYSGGTGNAVIGPIFRYNLEGTNSQYLNFITKYSISNNIIAGMVYETNNLKLGIGYDIGLFKNNVSNTGAFEVGLTLRRLQKLPTLKKRLRDGEKEEEKPIKTLEKPKSEFISKKEEEKTPEKEDKSVNTSARSGNIDREPHPLETLEVSFKFQFNNIELTVENEEYLSDLAELLQSEPRLRVQLIGHTDNVGTDAYNLNLSRQRAETVKNFLINKGIDEMQIDVEAKGEAEPVESNDTAIGREKNRRVELKLIYK